MGYNSPQELVYVRPARHNELFCSYLAAISGVLFTYPLQKVNIRQILSGHSAAKVTKYTVHEGYFLLYRGVFPQLLQKLSSITLLTLMYQSQYYSTKEQHKREPSKVYGGFVMGSIETIFMPFERIQSILAAKKYNQRYKNTIDVVKKLYTQQGIKELYRGLTVVYVRNVIGNIIMFSCIVEKRKYLGTRDASNKDYLKAFYNIFLDATTGTCVNTIVYPLNVVKIISHKRVGIKYYCMWAVMKYMYATTGTIKTFFNGIYINMTRSMLSWTVVASSNEFYKRCFCEAK